MKFIDKLLRRKSTAISTSQALAEELGVTYDSVSGRRISGNQAMRLTTVFGCVRVLSESVGMLPCRLMEQGAKSRNPATSHPLYRLLNVAPNDYMTAQEFWELLVACLCLRGNFYAYKVKGLGGRVSELLPIDPGAVEPKLDERWRPVYRVTFQNGSQDVLSQDEIWHVRLLTLDGLVGLNPVAYAREAIALGLDTEEHGAQLFRNGAVTTGVLSTEQTLTDKAYARLKKDFEERHGGLANNHKPMILEGGLNWKPISLNAEDSQFLQTRQFQRDEICAIYRVPPHLVANMEKATFSNIEHQGMNFVNYSLVPYLTRIEHRVQVGLLRPEDQARYYAKFNAGALQRGDLKARYESYGRGIQWGILSPNECRELEDLNPREGGDIYLTPTNMTTKPEAGNRDDPE
ncbi:phage portal protein [Halomonas nitroreducens]|uniref:Phage portal protein n=1 Tax=Halomonas nitroreducens TaxID=447425 RepID=A0A3S0HRL2_9GAMM|nr:phage portal protein [Halomonas nitroreducens]RTR01947.1 phage portal protein [Halomonas nitroreducens]